MLFQYGKIPEYFQNRVYVTSDFEKVLNRCFSVNVIKLINMYLYNIICRLFSEGYTSDIIYKILYPNLFSNKNIFWMMDFIFSTNMLNNKKYSFKYVEYLFLKRMRFYYNKLILIILII